MPSGLSDLSIQFQDKDQTCLIHANEEWSYRKLLEQEALLHGQLRPWADRRPVVLWIGKNSPRAVALFLACVKLNLWFFPVTSLDSAAAQQVLSQSSCTLFFENGNVDFFEKPAPSNFQPMHGCGLLMVSSGTQGVVKIAYLPLRMIEHNASLAKAILESEKIKTSVVWSSLHQTAGWNILLLASLLSGIPTLLQTEFNAFSALQTFKNLERCAFHFSPLQAMLTLRHRGWEHADLGRGHVAFIGSSDVFPRLLRDFLDKKFAVVRNYGLTEVGPIAISKMIRPDQDENPTLDDLGDLSQGLEARLQPSLIGQDLFHLELKGESVFAGYWNQEPQMENQWFATGDLVSTYKGKFFFETRANDIFQVSGINVIPNRIERFLVENMTDIQECRVSKSDDQSLLCEISTVGTRSFEDIRNKAQTLIQEHFRMASLVKEVARLERNLAGKIIREKPTHA